MAVVIAIHEIDDVAGFWSTIQISIPLGLTARLDAVYPLVNGSKAVSVWEGLSADDVGDVVDARLARFGRSEFYEVDPTLSAHLRGGPV